MGCPGKEVLKSCPRKEKRKIMTTRQQNKWKTYKLLRIDLLSYFPFLALATLTFYQFLEHIKLNCTLGPLEQRFSLLKVLFLQTFARLALSCYLIQIAVLKKSLPKYPILRNIPLPQDPDFQNSVVTLISESILLAYWFCCFFIT